MVTRHHDVAFHSPAFSPAAMNTTKGILNSQLLHQEYKDQVKINKYIFVNVVYMQELYQIIILPVLDKPVVLLSLSTIADSQDTVVELCLGASTLIVDTSVIELQ